MNGCLDNDFADEVDVFEDINPTIPPVNCTGASLYDDEDPILVGYSDPNNYASVSSSINLNTLKPCVNYNNIIPKSEAMYNSHPVPTTKQNCHNNSKVEHNSFRPVEPAQLTPSIQPSSDVGKSLFSLNAHYRCFT